MGFIGEPKLVIILRKGKNPRQQAGGLLRKGENPMQQARGESRHSQQALNIVNRHQIE